MDERGDNEPGTTTAAAAAAEVWALEIGAFPELTVSVLLVVTTAVDTGWREVFDSWLRITPVRLPRLVFRFPASSLAAPPSETRRLRRC